MRSVFKWSHGPGQCRQGGSCVTGQLFVTVARGCRGFAGAEIRLQTTRLVQRIARLLRGRRYLAFAGRTATVD